MLDKNLTPNKYFYCKNGLVLRSLLDLEQEFELNVKGINMENYNFHFFNNNNDYANWVDGVFGIKDLAVELRKAKSPKEALEEVRTLIKHGDEPNLDNKEQSKEKEEEKQEAKTEEKEEYSDNEEFDEEKEQEKIQNFSKNSDELLDSVKAMKKKIYVKPINLTTEIEKIEEEYVEVYKELSEQRKVGVDVFIPAVRLKNVKAKIQFLKVTREINDVLKIKEILETVRKDIEEAKNYEEPDLKGEILKGAGIEDTRYKAREES